MQVYNTLGRNLQPLETRVPGEVSMYVCGPTVQSAPHVGHGRQAVAFDVIRRYLQWRGYRVTFVTNITDVEDKIIDAAALEGVPTQVVAQRVAAQFFDAYRRLGVQPPDRLCYATASIPEMLSLVGRLVDRGHAYPAGGDVYFSVRSFSGYGKLSGRRLDELIVGARIEPGEHKRDPADFALWKASKPGEPTWDSPWGPGRPGWHLECSAMAEKELGFAFDIHGGGLDLVFPHHENEIAQSESAAGAAPFARYWLHNGMVTLGGDKMSKSTGNIVGLLDLLDRYQAQAVRLFFLRAHYRAPLDFSEESMDDATASLERLRSFRRRVGAAEVAAADPGALDRFRSAMDDDFNTAGAMAVLFDVVREGNRGLDGGGDGAAEAAAYDQIVGVLGLDEGGLDLGDLDRPLASLAGEVGVSATGSAEIVEGLIDRRAKARFDRNWALADRIRLGLGAIGIVLEDGANGTTWHRN